LIERTDTMQQPARRFSRAKIRKTSIGLKGHRGVLDALTREAATVA
jgi:hypothetical protein